MEKFKKSAAFAEFCNNHWMALIRRRSHEHDQIRMAHMDQCFHFPLKFFAQFVIFYQTLHLKLLHRHIRKFIFSLKNIGGGSFADF